MSVHTHTHTHTHKYKHTQTHTHISRITKLLWYCSCWLRYFQIQTHVHWCAMLKTSWLITNTYSYTQFIMVHKRTHMLITFHTHRATSVCMKAHTSKQTHWVFRDTHTDLQTHQFIGEHWHINRDTDTQMDALYLVMHLISQYTQSLVTVDSDTLSSLWTDLSISCMNTHHHPKHLTVFEHQNVQEENMGTWHLALSSEEDAAAFQTILDFRLHSVSLVWSAGYVSANQICLWDGEVWKWEIFNVITLCLVYKRRLLCFVCTAVVGVVIWTLAHFPHTATFKQSEEF